MVTTGTRGDKRLAAPFVLVPTVTPIKQFIPLTLLADIRPHLPCCLITALDHKKKKKKKKGVGMEEVAGDRKRVCVFSEGTLP